MTQRISIAVVALAFLAGCQSQNHDITQQINFNGTNKPDVVAKNDKGLSPTHHPVTATNAAAQQAFDDGLTLVYAFNHDQAITSFKHALELDPNLAMAHWGIALALGPNYNVDVDPPREKMAFDEIQKAKALSSKATPAERDYIDALARRYSDDPKADLKKLAAEYNAAMRELMKKYPDDMDAATLFADSGMDLRPWHLWTKDYKPEPGTEEIVATLERVLHRDPDHVGANHLYIHAVEGSDHPEWALESAGRLPSLAPSCGHLVHMPSHVYIRTGDYRAAAGSNEQAVEVDQEYIKENPTVMGVYTMMYYSHNLHFLAIASAIEGRYADAKKAADQLAEHVGPMVKDMPMLEGFMPTPTMIDVRFQKWEEILKSKSPPDYMAVTGILHHFARGMALAATGKIDDAMEEQKTFDALTAKLPTEAMYGPLNSAADVLSIAHHMLAAKIALAKSDRKTAIKFLAEAVKSEDKLNYAEPPDWYIPTRPALAALLIADGDAAWAEKVCREDLLINRRNPPSLFGLAESLKAQKKDYDADLVEREYKAASQEADRPLKLEDLF